MEALRYFGEGPDPKRRGFPAPPTMRTEDFFGIFKEFQAAYKKVKIDNVKIGEQRAMEAKRRAAAEEKEKERMEAKARKDAGVDDGAVLETLLGNLRSGGLTGKPKRKARERGQARRSAKATTNESGKGSTGQVGNESINSNEGGPDASSMTSPRSESFSTTADGEASSGSGATSLPGSPVEPSDKALSLLAQLQGGSSAPRPSTPAQRTPRRRERRGNDSSPSNAKDRDSSSSTAMLNNSSRLSQPPWNGEGEPQKVEEEKKQTSSSTIDNEGDLTQKPDSNQVQSPIEISEDQEEEDDQDEGRSEASDYSEAQDTDLVPFDPIEAARMDEAAIEADSSADPPIESGGNTSLDWFDPADLSFNSR